MVGTRILRPCGLSACSVGASIYIETYGCTFNVSDSEVLAGLLDQAGYRVVTDLSMADAVIINSCTVKDRSHLEFRKRLEELKRIVPSVVIAGCIPRVPAQSRELSAYSQLGTDTLADVVDVVERTLAGERVHRLARMNNERLSLPKVRRNPAVEIIPINKGCLGACAFCQTVIARGRLHSFPEEAITAQLESAVRDGVSHVWLTSQDCGAYGLDRDTNLPQLLRKVARVRGDYRVRVGMANPDLLGGFLGEYVDALADAKFYRFAHVPLQSGSNRVLGEMRRRYTADDFRRICEALRRQMPDVTIATDVIAGYPTETDEDFQQTLDLLSETRVAVVNRSRFSPRPGTAAARLQALPSRVVSERSRALSRVTEELVAADLRAWVGWRGDARVEDCSKPGAALARNASYKPLVLRGAFPPGQRVCVSAREVDGFHLVAEVESAANALQAGGR